MSLQWYRATANVQLADGRVVLRGDIVQIDSSLATSYLEATVDPSTAGALDGLVVTGSRKPPLIRSAATEQMQEANKPEQLKTHIPAQPVEDIFTVQ